MLNRNHIMEQVNGKNMKGFIRGPNNHDGDYFNDVFILSNFKPLI